MLKEKQTYIDKPALVLKVAQACWAANKYFVLACSQSHYQRIRAELREGIQGVEAAYQLIKEIENTYKDTASEDLPQIRNTLYHMAGYFKNLTPRKDRREMDQFIQESPKKALDRLEVLTVEHEVEYLLHTRLWKRQREDAFNNLAVPLRHKGTIYPPYTLWLENDYVVQICD